MNNARDFLDIIADLESIAATLHIISSPMLEGDNRASEELIGQALHGIATHAAKLAEEIADMEEVEKK